MNNENLQHCLGIYNERTIYAEKILQRLYEHYPELKDKYRKFRSIMISDIEHHISNFICSYYFDSNIILEHYMSWARQLYDSINIPVEEMVKTFNVIKNVLCESIHGSEQNEACTLFENGMRSFLSGGNNEIFTESVLDNSSEFNELAKDFFDKLISGDRTGASKLILDSVKDGVSISDIYIDVFQSSLREVGRLWQNNKISVGKEHYFTAATQLIMSQLYSYVFSTNKNGLKMVAASVSNELHEVGIRMLADIFELNGWNTVYLGASSPLTALYDILNTEKPELLCLSVTINPHLLTLASVIESLKNKKEYQDIKIYVGGYPFNIDNELWKKIGADNYAKDALTALDISEKQFM